jgi:hypothetical protein
MTWQPPNDPSKFCVKMIWWPLGFQAKKKMTWWPQGHPLQLSIKTTLWPSSFQMKKTLGGHQVVLHN